MKIKETFPLSKNISEVTYSSKNEKAFYIYDFKLFQIDLKSNEISEIYLLEDIKKFTSIKSINETTFIAIAPNELFLFEIGGSFANLKQHIKTDSFVKIVEATHDLSVIVGGGVMEKAVVITNNETRSFGTSSDLIAISGNGELIALCNEKDIEIYNTESLELIQTFKSSTYPTSIKFSPDHKTIIYGDERKNIVSINLEDESTFSYENDFGSKVINFYWVNEKEFFCFHLSSGVSKYQLGNEFSTDNIYLGDYENRHIRFGDVLDENTIVLCIEELQDNVFAKEGAPEENVLVFIEHE